MNEYTYQDLLRMQEEAKARVMEMRRRSCFLTEEFDRQEPSAQPRETEKRCFESSPEKCVKSIRMPLELPCEKPSQAAADGSAAFGGRRDPTVPSGKNDDAGLKNAARGNTGLSAALRSIFGSLGEEETEKMFILSLCLLLSQENGDEGLLLALMYLLT